MKLNNLNFRSDADYLVLAGDFNVDPRDGEVSIRQDQLLSTIVITTLRIQILPV